MMTDYIVTMSIIDSIFFIVILAFVYFCNMEYSHVMTDDYYRTIEGHYSSLLNDYDRLSAIKSIENHVNYIKSKKKYFNISSALGFMYCLGLPLLHIGRPQDILYFLAVVKILITLFFIIVYGEHRANEYHRIMIRIFNLKITNIGT